MPITISRVEIEKWTEFEKFLMDKKTNNTFTDLRIEP